MEVISFKIGALYEHYGDAVHWIAPPPTWTEEMNNDVLNTTCPELFGNEMRDTIVKIVQELDKTYDQRAVQRKNNAIVIREKFASSKIGRE